MEQFARDDFEQIAAKHLPTDLRKSLAVFPTDTERQFVFSAIVVPTEMTVWAGADNPGADWLNDEFWLRLIAHSRTMREMESWRCPPWLGWFERPEEGCPWWLARFDAWLKALRKSREETLRRRSPDITAAHPRNTWERDRAWAARVGSVIHHSRRRLHVPKQLLDELFEKLDKKQMAVFGRNLAGDVTPKHWKAPKLDCWLIEIWPLVAGYRLTYREAQGLAAAKFADADELVETILHGKHTTFVKHCKGLELRLEEEASATRGRPSLSQSEERESYLEGLKTLAVSCDPYFELQEGISKEQFLAVMLGENGKLELLGTS